MRTNRNIRIGIALIAGALLLAIIYLVARSTRRPVTVVETPPVRPVSIPTAKAVIAVENIPERSIITEEMVQEEDLPVGTSGVGFLTNKQSQTIGFITRRRIYRNERLRPGDLVGHISDVGIAGALMPGTRAIVVPINNKPTLHDLVRIGDYVDIVAAFDQEESRTIVENVRVLAVDIFGKDYPQTSVAMRGGYKAPPKLVRHAEPGSPPGANLPPGQPAPAPSAATPAPGQPPAQPQPQPAPQATPAPAPPAPALTLEVTPEQANRITLAQAAGAAIDFVLRPRESIPLLAPGAGPTRAVYITRARLAPYAERKRRSGGAKAAPASREKPRYVSTPPQREPGLPLPAGAGGIGPAVPQAPETYQIPVYADGKLVRVDTVPKPQEPR